MSLHPRLLAAVTALLGITLFATGSPAQTTIPSTTSSAPVAGAQLQGQALTAALRGGGYVIYFRHTATDFSRNDAGMRSYDDCDNQRLLSARGRADAASIGPRMRELQLPVGACYARPYCRTMEHARLMLGAVTPRSEIREADGGDYPGLKQLLVMPVEAGTNRWIVGHGNPFRAIAGPPHLMEGEAVVIRPGGRTWTVVARIAVGDWPTLGVEMAAPGTTR